MKKFDINIFLIFLLFAVNNNIYCQNVAPILTATGNQFYCPLTSIKIVTNMDIFDPDDVGIDAIYIQISSGYINGQDNLMLAGLHPTIVSNWDVSAGKLTLTGLFSQPTYNELISAVEDIEFFSASPSPSGARTFSISVGQANYLPSNGHYYLYVPNIGITWVTARTAAQTSSYYGLQGYLATITASDEAQLAGEQAAGAGWIGGSDEQTEGIWKWVTGPENGLVFWNAAQGNSPNFAYWNSGEPNNLNNEDYAHITAPGVGILGSWNDLSNTGETSGNYQPKGYIVEYGGTIGDPVLQIATSTSIIIPSITSFVNASKCGEGILNLQAISNTGVVNWYENSFGGMPIATGNNFTTPFLSSSTTYYAAPFASNCNDDFRVPITATIIQKPVITVSSPLNKCEDVSLNSIAQTTIGIINWYDSFTSLNPIFSGNSFNIPNITQDTVYYAEANNNGCLSDRIAVQVLVFPSPISNDEKYEICKGDSLLLDAQNPNATYLWSTGEITQIINYSGLANYSVDITNSSGCTKTKNFTITEITNPVITTILVNNLTVTIEVFGNGEFEYSIDGENYQTSNVFNLPEGGIYTSYVREKSLGCGIDFKRFFAISYPNYFSPNGDNFNDFWTIKGMSNYPNAEVKIFDRYGKFITKLDIKNQNWNGTLNGRLLQADDYWFVAKISEEFLVQKGHFSLKR